MNGRAFLALIAVSVMVLILACASLAFAHDQHRPDLMPWFKQLKSNKGFCCDGMDALHLRDVDWETKDGHYRVRVPKNGADMARAVAGETVETEWVDVPDDAVLDVPNKDGATLVWPLYGYMGISIRCFLPGTLA